MKENACIVLIAAAVFLGGCIVTSVYPFYTDRDLVFESALLGNWVNAGTSNTSSEYVNIERLGEKAYLATAFTTSETNGVEMHLFRLGQQLFIDTLPTNRLLDFVPVHQPSKLTRSGSDLETADLNYDWLAKLVEKSPAEIRHILLCDKPAENTGGRVVLTATTMELQRFLLKHLNNTNAWKEPSKWKRRV